MGGVASAEKIGADEHRKIEEVQKGPLGGHKKEDDSCDGHKEEDNY